MRRFLLRLLSEPPATAPSDLPARVAELERKLAEQHRRLLEVEGSEAVREAAHAARMDALSRLYKRVSQRFVDAAEASPAPQRETVSVAELRARLRK